MNATVKLEKSRKEKSSVSQKDFLILGRFIRSRLCYEKIQLVLNQVHLCFLLLVAGVLKFLECVPLNTRKLKYLKFKFFQPPAVTSESFHCMSGHVA